MGGAAKETDGCQEWGALGLALREILGSTSHAIITTDREHRIVGWNEQAERLYGYSEDEVAGKSILEIVAVRCRRRKAARVAQILQRGECFSGELRILTKAGKSVPAHACFKALRDKSGQELGYMGILIDLSTFRDREENLRSKNRSLRAFTQVALSLCSPMRTKETLQQAVRCSGTRIPDNFPLDRDRSFAGGLPLTASLHGPRHPPRTIAVRKEGFCFCGAHRAAGEALLEFKNNN